MNEAPKTAKDIMTSDPIVISPETTIAKAMDIVEEEAIRHLPVVENDKLVGIISATDLLSLSLAHLASVEDGYARLWDSLTVASLMEGDVLTVYSNTPLSEVIDMIVSNYISAVPVVDTKDEKIIGIISTIDIIRAAAPYFELNFKSKVNY